MCEHLPYIVTIGTAMAPPVLVLVMIGRAEQVERKKHGLITWVAAKWGASGVISPKLVTRMFM